MIKEWWARTFRGGGGAGWCVLLEIGFCYFQSEEILEIASSLMENTKKVKVVTVTCRDALELVKIIISSIIFYNLY